MDSASRHEDVRDVVGAVLAGRPAPFVPVAQVYECLGPLESYHKRLRWQAWSRRLEEAGAEALAVGHEDCLAVELEVWTKILEGPYPPPTWLGLPTMATQEEVAGAAVVRRGGELFWVTAEGRERWLPPSLAAEHEALAAGANNPYAAARWEGADLRDLEGEQPAGPLPDPRALAGSSRYALARELAARYGEGLAYYSSCPSPYWSLELGFQQRMRAMVEQPAALHRLLEQRVEAPLPHLEAERALGVQIAFVEECMASADLISPQMYSEFSFPYTKRLLDRLAAMGFATVLYFSGNLMPLLPRLAELPFTALSCEEDRKGYGIDLAQVRCALGPDRVLFGNLDASFVERAADSELLAAVERQIEVAGPRRFLVSAGSPLTPDTSLARVRFFVESTRRLAGLLPAGA